MHLGKFWGITAPMLVIATKKNGIEKIKPAINALSENKSIINDLKTELVYLYNAVDSIPKKYYPPNGFETVESMDKSIRFAKGKLFDAHIDEHDFYLSFTMGCVLQILKKSSKSGNAYALPVKKVKDGSDPICFENRMAVIKVIQSLISEEDFYLSGIKKVYRTVLKKLEAKGNGCDPSSLAKSFNLIEKIPDSIIIDGKTVTFTEKELGVLEFYAESKSTIRELLVNLKVKEVVENKIFGRSFRTLINSNPRALYWNVQERFDIVKSKNNDSFLKSLLKEMSTDIERFNESVKSDVITQSAYNNSKISMSDESYWFKVKTFRPAKEQFFKNLKRNGYVKAEDLIEENLNLLSSIYDIVEELGILGLNDFFGLDYTLSDWREFITKLNAVGICGVNLFSVELLANSIENMTFISNHFVVKSEEELENFSNVIENIAALLDTIQPIGAVLD